MHLPPPVHGASVVGQNIQNSKYINSTFYSRYINLSASSKVEEVGSLSIKKLLFLISNWIHCISAIIRFKPTLCYITPTSDGWGFYRDFLLVQSIKLFDVKIVMHFHNKASKQWVERGINRWLLKHFFKNVKIILLGKELYEEKSSFISENDVFFCPNGVPSVNDKILKTNKKIDKTRFLFLSNMMESKGVLILLDACKELYRRGYDFRCDFVGGWKDVTEELFQNRIKKYNLQDKVYAHGPKYGDEKKMFFENADVFVFPTYYHGECFPLVLLEAMDYGLPCLSTVNGAIPSLIDDGLTGFTVPQNDLNALVLKMIWSIENPEKMIELGVFGKEKFESYFTLEQFEKNLTSIFQECIKS
ncbi:Glycosyltransferase involved in cell wall bisynthesis [Pseudozobellia thermophila]|uniref:Glycosyltransferase involved in cell wall bisynthesis n=1 Tax=Pseudozobellia thermophila TaxID=192903 RepID=A0A1M6KR93_9FLAO|nr:Glycosyltransferase involved in cell wall bisynthesis [Pseudozobellia thermophila]